MPRFVFYLDICGLLSSTPSDPRVKYHPILSSIKSNHNPHHVQWLPWELGVSQGQGLHGKSFYLLSILSS